MASSPNCLSYVLEGVAMFVPCFSLKCSDCGYAELDWKYKPKSWRKFELQINIDVGTLCPCPQNANCEKRKIVYNIF